MSKIISRPFGASIFHNSTFTDLIFRLLIITDVFSSPSNSLGYTFYWSVCHAICPEVGKITKGAGQETLLGPGTICNMSWEGKAHDLPLILTGEKEKPTKWDVAGEQEGFRVVCWEESQLAQVHKLPSAPAGLTVAHKLRKGSQSVPGQVKGKAGTPDKWDSNRE